MTTYQSSNVLTGFWAGTFTVYAKDANGCIQTGTVNFENPPDMTLASVLTTSQHNGYDNKCNLSSEANAEVRVTGGTSPYRYSNDDNTYSATTTSTSYAFNGLVAGTYTFYVKDANNIKAQATQVVTAPTAVTISATPKTNLYTNGTMISCYGQSDAQVVVTPGGGVGGYTYKASSGTYTNYQTSSTLTGLAAGTHTVYVKDANDCELSTTVTITQPNQLAFSGTPAPLSPHNGRMISCYGASDGSIAVAVTGGTGTMAYSLSGTSSASTTIALSTHTFTGLTAGTYTVNVTDQNTCNITQSSIIITQPNVLSLTLTNHTGAVHLADAATVTLRAVISGGTQSDGSPAYSYAWSKPSSATSPSSSTESNVGGTVTRDFTISSADLDDNGVYTLTVTDRNGCTDSKNVRVIVYNNDIYVDDNNGSSDTEGDGSPTNPLRTIQKAIDVAKATNVIWVQAGTYNESPEITKALTFDGGASALLESGRFFIYNTTGTVSWTSSWNSSTSTVFSSVGVKPNGNIATALGKVTEGASAKLYIIGDHVIKSANATTGSITVSKQVVIAGANTNGSTNISYTGCNINPPASITLSSAAGATELTMFKFTGTATKGVSDLALKIRNTGFFFEISNGSSGAVNPVTNTTFEWDHDGDNTVDAGGNAYRRLFGIQNASYSAGDKWDVAKFVNDASESASGFGSGYVTYSNNGPLPSSALTNGWQATDGNTKTNNTDVSPLYPLKGAVNLAGGNFPDRKPNFINTGGHFNSTGHLKFDGSKEWLEANTNSDINGTTAGGEKSLFLVFQSSDGAADQVIYKHGDQTNGMSVVHLSTGMISVNVYNGTNSDGSNRESWIFDSGSETGFDGDDLILQIYFNGSSDTSRVAAALFDVNGRITEDVNHTGAAKTNGYVSSTVASDGTGFSVSQLSTPTIGTASLVSMGCRSGSVYYRRNTGTVDQSITLAGRTLWSRARVAELLVYNSANEAMRDAVYCYLRNKYFSSGNGTGNTLNKTGEDEVIAGEDRTSTTPDIVAYPNPVDAYVDIEAVVPVGGTVTVTLRDALGREVATLFRGDVTDNTILPIRGEVSLVPSGAYIIHVAGAGDLNLTTPIIIRH
jgi:hypothetical protein